MTARTTAEQRAEISRANGRRSHGPVSTEGKCRSRMNAVKHGMTARIPVLPGEDEATFRQRVEGIVDSLAPRNPLELALAEQAALSLWKIERAERAEATRVTASIRTAEARADAHHQEELHALGRWLMAHSVKAKREAADDLLAFLPEDRHAPFKAGRGEPLVILLRIQATADGCRWLIDRWIALGAKLERNRDWDMEEMIEAVQLRGERPLYVETPDWECLLQERYTRGNPAYVAEGRRQLLDQLTDGRPADPAGTVMVLRDLVKEEVARLEELEKARQESEEVDRSELADRLAVDATPEGERVRRYQLDCDRKLHRAIQGVLKLRRGEGIGAGDDPAPDGIAEQESKSEGEGTVAVRSGPGDGPESEADPILDLGDTVATLPGRDPAAVRAGLGSSSVDTNPTRQRGSEPRPSAPAPPIPSLARRVLDTSSPLPDPESPVPDPDVAEPVSAEVAAPAGLAAQPEGGLVPQHEHEPTSPADAERTPRNEPRPLAAERTPENEPGPPAAERTPENEPGPPVGGDLAPQNEPAGPGPMAGPGVPALVCALLIVLATGLPAAFAGPVAGPIGRPSMTPAARAGPAVRVGPFPRSRLLVDDAGQDVGRALRHSQAGTPGGKDRIPETEATIPGSRPRSGD